MIKYHLEIVKLTDIICIYNKILMFLRLSYYV